MLDSYCYTNVRRRKGPTMLFLKYKIVIINAYVMRAPPSFPLQKQLTVTIKAPPCLFHSVFYHISFNYKIRISLQGMNDEGKIQVRLMNPYDDRGD